MANALEKQVMRIIGENVDSPDVFSDIQPIRDAISDAIQEIILLTGGYREKFAIPMVTGKTFYRLTLRDGEMGWVESAWMLNRKIPLSQTDLIMLNRNDPRWLTRKGLPEEYFPVGNDAIGLSPKPTSSSDILELDMVVIPAPYTNDTYRIKLRDEFRFGVVNYAVSEYYAGVGDAKRASDHFTAYADTLGLRRLYPGANERILQSDTAKMITEANRVVSQ
jgi:hypothetical protein